MLQKAKVEVMVNPQKLSPIISNYSIVFVVVISERKCIYCTGFIVTGNNTLFLVRQLPEDTLSNQPVVNAGGRVRGQKQVYNVCAIS